jgi:phosphotriesterase-related protein
LCAQGYADRIVLSHDASCYIDYFSGEKWQAAKEQAAPGFLLVIVPDFAPAHPRGKLSGSR